MQKIILWFYKCSLGELNVGLPILRSIKRDNPDITIYFIFKTVNDYNSILDVHKTIVRELGITVIGLRKYYFLLRKKSNANALIMTCLSGHTEWSLIAYKKIQNSIVVFHHHAYAIQNMQYANYSFFSNANSTIKYFSSKYGNENSRIILNEKMSMDYYESIGFRRNNMLVAGAIGYSDEWKNYFDDKSSSSQSYTELKNRINDADYERVYFVPIRMHHPLYLTQENYEYLFLVGFNTPELCSSG